MVSVRILPEEKKETTRLFNVKKRYTFHILFLVVILTGLFTVDLFMCTQNGGSVRLRKTVDLHFLLYALLLLSSLFCCMIFFIRHRTFNSPDIVPLICCAVLLIFYVNYMIDTCFSGDTLDYADAVKSLLSGASFPSRYLYPPFFAILFKPIVSAGGGRALFDIIWILNVASVGILYYLIVKLLRLYGCGLIVASISSFVFMILNVALQRTLKYGQINTWVTVCCLLCILLYASPKLKLLSPLLLAVAIHLKASPIICCIPFLLAGEFVWCFHLIIYSTLILLGTVLTDGITPYNSFIKNVFDMHNAIGFSYRDGSVDAIVLSFSRIVQGIDDSVRNVIVMILKITCFAYGLKVMTAIRKSNVFPLIHPEKFRQIAAMMPAAMILMVIMSPVVWEHHPIFATLPFMASLLTIRTRNDLLIVTVSFFSVFWLPPFDFFPWSYGKTIGLLVLLVYYHHCAVRSAPGLLQNIDLTIGIRK